MAKGMFESSRPRKPEGYLPGVHTKKDLPRLAAKEDAKYGKETRDVLSELQEIEEERIWAEKTKAAKEGQAKLAEISDDEIDDKVENLGPK